MEYPTFITAGTAWWAPDGLKFPEAVVEHEFGHQYWYGMVATNEFEEAWLDEGINQYTECKIMDALYGRDVDILNTRVATAGERGTDRIGYIGAAEYDPIIRRGWQFVNSGSYGGITYSKTALVLLTLEHFIGEQKVREAQHIYFERYRFKHPTGDDFMNTVNEVAGQNLDWYWNQAVRGTQVLDYRIQRAESYRADWADKNAPKKEKKGETEYVSSVVVHRRGDFVLPVTLEVKFDNGEILREHWDGQDRWHRSLVGRFQEPRVRKDSRLLDADHAVVCSVGVLAGLRRDFETTDSRWFLPGMAAPASGLVGFLRQPRAWIFGVACTWSGSPLRGGQESIYRRDEQAL